MSAVTDAKEKVKELGSQGGGKDSLAKKIFVPLAASAASAAAAYAVRKLPALVQEKVMPKLKGGRSSGAAGDVLSKAKDAVGETVSTVADRVSELRESASGSSRSPGPSLSSKELDELERRRKERAKHRAERRKALSV